MVFGMNFVYDLLPATVSLVVSHFGSCSISTEQSFLTCWFGLQYVLCIQNFSCESRKLTSQSKAKDSSFYVKNQLPL